MKPPPTPPARLDLDELRRREASSRPPPELAGAVRLFVWGLLVFAFGLAVGAALVGLGR